MLGHPRLAMLAGLVIVGILTLGILVAWHWPFNEANVTHALEATFSSRVSIGNYTKTFFPVPGCRIENFALTRTPGARTPPLLAARSLTIRGSWLALFTFQHRVAALTTEGLRISIPGHIPPPLPIPDDNITTLVGDAQLDGAELDVTTTNHEELRFDFPHLALHNLAKNTAIQFRTAMHNPEPPSDIKADGTFGPWNPADPKLTPISGRFDFSHGDLSRYRGVSGIVASSGSFKGNLGQISVSGRTDTPDFEVKSSGHKIHLTTQYRAVVNGMNGDTRLESVTADFLQTHLDVTGEIAGQSGQHGKTAVLDFDGRKARIEDLLEMFASGNPPAMKGPITLRAHVVLPSEKRPFLRRLRLDGAFEIDDGSFAAQETKNAVAQLSERARGQKSGVESPENVSSTVNGAVSLRDGIASLNRVSFAIPGAVASGSGTYDVISEKIDLHGTLAMAATLSKASTGFKSVLLKPLNKFFERKYAGAVISVALTGTYHQPSFSTSLTGKKSDPLAASVQRSVR